MTILKYKEPSTATGARQAAGDRQEQDVAFYLRRAFKDDENILVLNDYRFTHNGETAQIDHLILHRTGFIIIESKSIYGEVKVNTQGEWARSYKGQWSGMPSPIRQAELQMELLRAFLGAHVDQFLGKLLGRVQMKVRYREWNVLCTVSNSCILHRDSIPSELNKQVVKSEFIADDVQKIGGYSRLGSVFSGKPNFSLDELARIGDFLLQHYQPKSTPQPETMSPPAASEPPVIAPVARAEVDSVTEPEPTFITVKTTAESPSKPLDMIGLVCKKCGSDQQLTALYGQYGYYVKCGHCSTNTSMKTACPECNSTKARVRKKGDEYWLQCECSLLKKLYQQQ